MIMKRYIETALLENKQIELVHEFDTLKAKYQTEKDESLSKSLYYQLNYLKAQIDLLKDIFMNTPNTLI